MALSIARYISVLLCSALLLLPTPLARSQSSTSCKLPQTITASAGQRARRADDPALCDALRKYNANIYANAICSGAGGGPNPTGVGTSFAPRDDKLNNRDLALLARQQSLGTKYLYQISPDRKDSATLKAFTGSIILTFDLQHASLKGRAQSIISLGVRDELAAGLSLCDSGKNPVRLFSGMGSNVTILVADIAVQGGGIIHITDGLFTVPSPLSTTLSGMVETSVFNGVLKSSNFSAGLDTSPLITVFVPSNQAFAAGGANRTFSSSELTSLVNAHLVQGVAAYSPSLVDGARLTGNSGEMVINAKSDGTIIVNGIAKVVRSDVLVENGVVHVIDKLLYTPPTPKVTPTSGPATFTGTASWSAVDQTRVAWDSPLWWSIIIGIAIPCIGGAAALAM